MATNRITKREKLEFIRRKLGTVADKALATLKMLYRNQTAMERAFRGQMLEEKNGRGFTAFDSPLLTSLAEQFITKKRLSDRQLQILFQKMPKYARQVLEVADNSSLHEAIMREKEINGNQEKPI